MCYIALVSNLYQNSPWNLQFLWIVISICATGLYISKYQFQFAINLRIKKTIVLNYNSQLISSKSLYLII